MITNKYNRSILFDAYSLRRWYIIFVFIRIYVITNAEIFWSLFEQWVDDLLRFNFLDGQRCWCNLFAGSDNLLLWAWLKKNQKELVIFKTQAFQKTQNNMLAFFLYEEAKTGYAQVGVWYECGWWDSMDIYFFNDNIHDFSITNDDKKLCWEFLNESSILNCIQWNKITLNTHGSLQRHTST